MSENPEFLTMHEEVQAMKAEFQELKNSINGMVKAWEAAGSVLTMFKYLAIVGAAVAAFWASVKNGILGYPHP